MSLLSYVYVHMVAHTGQMRMAELQSTAGHSLQNQIESNIDKQPGCNLNELQTIKCYDNQHEGGT